MVPFLTVYKGKCKTTFLSCWQPFWGHQETLLQAKENLVGGGDQSRVLGVTLTRTTAPMTVPSILSPSMDRFFCPHNNTFST